ncbi:MAG: GIY-YIG nuclease family protein [Selenomonadaceae bacterium]|nr:GIY-YIG nuclease family protein [Selenomonadaceae bacterium]
MIAIYKITNRLNNKPYVGQTRQPIEKRFMQHLNDNTPLGDAMRA